MILRRGGGGVPPLPLLRSRGSENFGEGGGVDRMKGATCGVGVVNVLILTGVAVCEDGETFLTAVAPLAGGGGRFGFELPEMVSSCWSSRQILWMSLSMSRSVLSVLGSFLRPVTPPPLRCRSLAGLVAGLLGGCGALKRLISSLDTATDI